MILLSVFYSPMNRIFKESIILFSGSLAVILITSLLFNSARKKEESLSLVDVCKQSGYLRYDGQSWNCDDLENIIGKITREDEQEIKEALRSSSLSPEKITTIIQEKIISKDIDSLDWDLLKDYPNDCGSGKAVRKIGDKIECISIWNDHNDIPSASPSDGDRDHFSTADQIYDWVINQGYSTSSGNGSVSKDDLTDLGSLSFDWDDSEISDALTINNSGSVDWESLISYPTACSAGKAVQAIGDTLTCVDVSGGTSLWTDSGSITYLTSTSDDLALGGTDSSAPFFFDTGSSKLYVDNLRVGGTSDYLEITSSGQLVFSGNATVWDDIRVPVTSAKAGGSKVPGFEKFKDNGSGSQGVFTYMFDASQEEELYFTVQLPHSYKPGSDIYPHVHWTTTSNNTGNVRWGLEYTWSTTSSVFSNSTILTATSAASGTAYTSQYTAFSAISGTGKNESSMLVCRVFRDADDSGDTHADDTALLEIDFHFEKEKMGTDNQNP